MPLKKEHKTPFSQLILMLKAKGYKISVSDILEIEKILLAQNILELSDTHPTQLKLTVDKLPHLITPIIAKNQKEQEDLSQIIREFVEEQKKTDIETVGGDNKTTHKPGWGLNSLAVIAALAFVILFFYMINRTPRNLSIQQDNSSNNTAVGDTAKFSATAIPNIQKNEHFEWVIDNSKLKNASNQVTHVFDKEGESVHVISHIRDADSSILASDTISLNIACSNLEIRQENNDDPQTGLPLLNTNCLFVLKFSNNKLNKDSFSYKWFVNDTLLGRSDSFQYIFHEKKNYFLNVTAYTNGHCLTDSLTATRSIELEKMPPDQILISGTFDIDQNKIVNPWWKALVFVLCLSIAIFFIRYYSKRNRKQKRTLPDIAWVKNTDEPFDLQLNKKNDFIGFEAPINRIANLLRSNQKTNGPTLNIYETIRSTSEKAGFPSLKFKSQQKRNEFLVLQNATQLKNNHLAELFEWFIQGQKKEDVNIETLYYTSSPDILSDEKGNIVTLKQLARTMADHFLIIFDDCRNLITEKAITLNHNNNLFHEWNSKAIITPVPLIDWGTTEFHFQANNFLVAPAEIEAIELLSKELVSDGQIHKQRIYPFLERPYAISGFDFNDINDLKEYLENETLFQWVCALAVYPRLDWTITISLGISIAEVMGRESKENKINIDYNTLLKIARIKLLQEDRLPDGLRLELLKNLRKDIHLLAREKIVFLLEEIKDNIPANSLSMVEWKTQYITNAFFLYINNPDKYKHYKDIQDSMESIWPTLTDWPLIRLTAVGRNNLLHKKDSGHHATFDDFFNPVKQNTGLRMLIASLIITPLMVLVYKFSTDIKYTNAINFIPKKYNIDLLLEGDTCFKKFQLYELSYTPSSSGYTKYFSSSETHYRIALTEDEFSGTLHLSGVGFNLNTFINFKNASNLVLLKLCEQNKGSKIEPIDTLQKKLISLLENLPVKPKAEELDTIKSFPASYKVIETLKLSEFRDQRQRDSISLIVNQIILSNKISPNTTDEDIREYGTTYFNERGQIIYKTQDNNPGKTFIIRTSKDRQDIYSDVYDADRIDSVYSLAPVLSISSKTARQVEQLLRRGDITNTLVTLNIIEIPNANFRKKMMQVINRDDGSGGERPNNNREYGGLVNPDSSIISVTGPVLDYIRGSDAQFPIPNRRSILSFHSHPSGTKDSMIDDRLQTVFSYIQAPSKDDISNATSYGYVFGMRSKIVYIYNREGIIATIPFSVWNYRYNPFPGLE